MTPANEQQENSRRRIVVPLGSVPGKPRDRFAAPQPMPAGRAETPRGRAAKILALLGLVLVAVVLALAVGAFLWWHHYQSTPAYSLALLIDAAQRNDMPGVDRIVDSDKIVDNFTGQVIEKSTGRYGSALSGELRKTIRTRVPDLLPSVKQLVRDAVAARVREISTRADKKPFFFVALAIPYFVNVTTTGDKANASFTIQDQQIRMDLERSGDIWRIVAMQDDVLVQRMVDEVIKELPAIGKDPDSRKKERKPPPLLRLP